MGWIRSHWRCFELYRLRDCFWHSVGRGQDASKHPTMQKTTSPIPRPGQKRILVPDVNKLQLRPFILYAFKAQLSPRLTPTCLLACLALSIAPCPLGWKSFGATFDSFFVLNPSFPSKSFAVLWVFWNFCLSFPLQLLRAGGLILWSQSSWWPLSIHLAPLLSWLAPLTARDWLLGPNQPYQFLCFVSRSPCRTAWSLLCFVLLYIFLLLLFYFYLLS